MALISARHVFMFGIYTMLVISVFESKDRQILLACCAGSLAKHGNRVIERACLKKKKSRKEAES